MIPLLILLGTLLAVPDPPPAVPPLNEISCEDVRAFVASHGRARSLAWALRQGATLADVRKAARCLK